MLRPIMGKHLSCPRCHAANEYDVPKSEVTTPLREVKCRACGHDFPYGYAPEYVTEVERPPPEDPRIPDDPAVEYAAARQRLERYVARYLEYADRDRDVLLLYMLDLLDHLGSELGAIKRAQDVLVRRVTGK